MEQNSHAGPNFMPVYEDHLETSRISALMAAEGVGNAQRRNLSDPIAQFICRREIGWMRNQVLCKKFVLATDMEIKVEGQLMNWLTKPRAEGLVTDMEVVVEEAEAFINCYRDSQPNSNTIPEDVLADAGMRSSLYENRAFD